MDNKPRQSTTGLAPRQSMTGQNYKYSENGVRQRISSAASSTAGGVRRSYRGAGRRSSRSMAADGEVKLQVIDDAGVDRTPKPLLSISPSVLKGLPGGTDDTGTPTSERSDFFMDRMSSTGFSRLGFYSETNSGVHTPKSELEEEYDYAAEKEKAKKQREELAAAAEKEEEEAAARHRNVYGHDTLPVSKSVVLTERDLEKQVYVELEETETIFLLELPRVTVAIDSEEAKAVEAANKRYDMLLATKQATDKYNDVETQTLDLMKKTKEVQSAVLHTNDSACQVSNWEISDTYQSLDEAAADAEDDKGGMPAMQSMQQLVGGVAHGSGYTTAGMIPGSAGGASMEHSRRETATSLASFAPRESFFSNSGAVPGSKSEQADDGGLPPGAGPLDSVQSNSLQLAPSPLRQIAGLLEALKLMDYAVQQNNYLPRLLLYRNIQPPLPSQAGASSAESWDAASTHDDTASVTSHVSHKSYMSHKSMAHPVAAASRPSSRGANAVSRPTSRAASESQSVADARGPGSVHERQSLHNATSMRSRQRRTSAVNSETQSEKQGPAAGRGGYAASVAESNWPEELLQDLADLGEDAPRMELLWEWTCPETAGCKVACMAWNKANPDLLAVGYGSFAFNQDASTQGSAGMVVFWSLKNPGHPLWSFQTKTGVTALDFAAHSANILAVGLYSGTVAIYDVKTRQGTASMESDVSSGKHADPVWKLKWIDRGAEREELLVSISTDGRVTQWSITKGLEFSDLMKLKRVPRKPQQVPSSTGKPVTAAEQHDAFISRLTSGMSFDFSSRDERMYIAGTEDGWIHLCSTSYSEQYLESYQGHMGPVYQVQWSPFKPGLFVSCSGDWSIRMWQEGREQALLTFMASNQEIFDVQWCPFNSTVFASVTSGGRLEIWDFALSTVKPVMHIKTNVRQSCVLFSPNCPVVVCGGDSGSIRVFRLYNVDREYDTKEEQLDRLEEVLRANAMKAQPGQAS